MNTASFQLVTGGTPGLLNDASVLSAALSERFDASINVSRQRNLHLPFKRLQLWWQSAIQKQAQVGIFLENIPTGWVDVFQISVFIPNQEWLREDTLANLERCQEVWCKTLYATELFRQRGYKARYVGFTSRDRFLPSVEKDYACFIHIPGRSLLKGSTTLLSVWAQHPEWPTLTVVTSRRELLPFACKNIVLITAFLDDEALGQLMNRAGVHLCTSETEGFGHYLNEALSTQAVVITTDAPPMNELVTDTFGSLVSFEKSSTQGWSERFFVDPVDLETKIGQVIMMNTTLKEKLGGLARAKFIERSLLFKRAIIQAALEL